MAIRGAIVSAWCLGTMTFGDEADEATSFAMMDLYAKAGGNLLDTANVYSRGKSEEIVGRWLKAHPTEARQMLVATKGRFTMGDGPNDLGVSRRHLGLALDASLKRLGVERIDLYQMHAWDALTPLEETLRFLDDAVRAGKIAYYGFSNYLGWQVAKAVQVAKAAGFTAPVTLQPHYNLIVRDIEFEIVPACLDAGMGLLPWSPLGGGLAHRQIQARHGADRQDAARGQSQSRAGGVWAAQRVRPGVGDCRRARGDRQGTRGQHGGSRARLDVRTSGGDVGDPRGADGRAAGGEPQGRRADADGGRNRAARCGERAGDGRLPVWVGWDKPAQPDALGEGSVAAPSQMTRTLLLRISGVVQGVGYRAWAEDQAKALGLAGWVRNRRDGSVEALVSGETAAVEQMVGLCWQGSHAAKVERVESEIGARSDAGRLPHVAHCLTTDFRSFCKDLGCHNCVRARSLHCQGLWLTGCDRSFGGSAMRTYLVPTDATARLTSGQRLDIRYDPQTNRMLFVEDDWSADGRGRATPRSAFSERLESLKVARLPRRNAA